MKKNVYLYAVIGLITLIVSCSKDDSEPSEPKDDETAINFQGQIDIADDMIDNYENLLLENSAEQSRALLVESLKGISDINDVGISEDGTTVYWEFSDGLEYYFLTETSLSVDSEKGNGRISNRQNLRKSGDFIIPENKNALVLSPYYYQWSLLEKPDESDDIRTMLNDNGYNVNYKLNAESSQSNISLDDYKQFSNYSVIAISTHGGIAKDGEVFINSGVPITEDLKAILKDDIENKRVAITFSKKWVLFDGPKVLALKSSWFDNEYDTKLNQTLVHIGACKGYYNQSLSNALIGNESAFFGWTHNVNTFTNRDNAIDLFQNLVEGSTVEEAYNEVSQNGSTVSGKASFNMSQNSYSDLAIVQKDFDFAGTWTLSYITMGTDGVEYLHQQERFTCDSSGYAPINSVEVRYPNSSDPSSQSFKPATYNVQLNYSDGQIVLNSELGWYLDVNDFNDAIFYSPNFETVYNTGDYYWKHKLEK